VTVLALVVASLALAVSLALLAVTLSTRRQVKAVTRVVRTYTTPSGVVTFDGPLSGDDFRRFRAEFDKHAGTAPLTGAQLKDVAERFRAAWASEPRRPL
jgi:hypothetical protein